MGRLKGSKNRMELSESGRIYSSTLPIDERLKIFANLIIDRILEDITNKKLPAGNSSSKNKYG